VRSFLLIAAASSMIAFPASAHVTIWPKQSIAGAREKYAVRVPNEKKVPTVALELGLPDGLRLTSIEQKAGWKSELVRDAHGSITGIRWTGELAPMEFAEFGVLAINPPQAGEIAWRATQVFADGSKVEWIGRDGSAAPAPKVILVPPASR
jgi:YD repeat-containing protein